VQIDYYFICHICIFQGVVVNGLGTFTFTQKKLDIGNNKFILMQRPIFTLSEKFAQTHNLQHPKYHVPGKLQSRYYQYFIIYIRITLYQPGYTC